MLLTAGKSIRIKPSQKILRLARNHQIVKTNAEQGASLRFDSETDLLGFDKRRESGSLEVKERAVYDPVLDRRKQSPGVEYRYDCGRAESQFQKIYEKVKGSGLGFKVVKGDFTH